MTLCVCEFTHGINVYRLYWLSIYPDRQTDSLTVIFCCNTDLLGVQSLGLWIFGSSKIRFKIDSWADDSIKNRFFSIQHDSTRFTIQKRFLLYFYSYFFRFKTLKNVFSLKNIPKFQSVVSKKIVMLFSFGLLVISNS